MRIGQQLMSRLISGGPGRARQKTSTTKDRQQMANPQRAENVRREPARAERKFLA